MTYTPGGQEPQQPQQPAYSAPQQSYSTPQYDVGQQSYSGYAAPRPKSDKRTLGLWATILGLSGLLIPLFVNNLAAVGLGIAGLVKENSKATSITGIVSGGIGFIWAFAFWPLVLTAIFLAIGAATYSSY
ncbi:MULTISPECIES: hypothetical protein [unclassified Agrococcus]|uniref:hypothetical protein n=1 Tax=unclassified Agrococcus TaxID=2615065 RepID=UPI003623F6DB